MILHGMMSRSNAKRASKKTRNDLAKAGDVETVDDHSYGPSDSTGSVPRFAVSWFRLGSLWLLLSGAVLLILTIWIGYPLWRSRRNPKTPKIYFGDGMIEFEERPALPGSVPIQNPAAAAALHYSGNSVSEKGSIVSEEVSGDVIKEIVVSMNDVPGSLSSPSITFHPGSAESNIASNVWQPWSREMRAEKFKQQLERFMANIPLDRYRTASLPKALHSDSFLHENGIVVHIRDNNEIFYEHRFQPANRHSRLNSLKGLLSALSARATLPRTSFLVVLNDGSRPSYAAFGALRGSVQWQNMIPFPMGNTRGWSTGFGLNFTGWDAYAETWYLSKHSDYPWSRKIPKAVFRGNFAMTGQEVGSCWISCNIIRDWKQVARGLMYLRTKDYPELFDVKFTSKGTKKGISIDEIPADASFKLDFADFMRYKAILNVGTNNDWAERLRNLLFANSVILFHEVKCEEWFYAFLEPMVHYVPLRTDMSDIVDRQRWIIEHDAEAQQIVRNALAFAKSVLTEDSMLEYAKIAIEMYAAKQKLADSAPLA